MHYIAFKYDTSIIETSGVISAPNDFTVWDTE